MTPELISTAYFINPSVSLCASLLSMVGKGMIKHIPPFIAKATAQKTVPTATNTCNNKKIVGHMCCVSVYYPIVVNNSVKTFLQQQKIVGGIIFYMVHVLSEERRPSALPRTSY
jgi:hypothetical protein